MQTCGSCMYVTKRHIGSYGQLMRCQFSPTLLLSVAKWACTVSHMCSIWCCHNMLVVLLLKERTVVPSKTTNADVTQITS